jgi:GH15 family glucan-1,4-alpha-glucosidase
MERFDREDSAMPRPIEGYAVIGDCRTAALVGDDGSIDWLCMPRFDSASIFAALLGDEEQGHWKLRPADDAATTSREYATDTFTLITRWVTADGEVEVTDLLSQTGPGDLTDVVTGSDRRSDVIRRVRGIRGNVTIRQELRVRFDYAASLPWMRQVGTADAPALLAVAGPDALVIRGPKLDADGHRHVGEFTVAAGETVDVQLTWFPAHRPMPNPRHVDGAIIGTQRWWQGWAQGSAEPGAYDEIVRRSLLVLRMLTHEETGGIVAAPTTSLPEDFGGSRNWDYRYVWLRDAALTLEALINHGYTTEAEAWRQWLLRAIAGDPADLQIMYGLAGERRLTEWDVPTLPGYAGSSPVRVGNAASKQYQGDVFGEIMMALDATRHFSLDEDGFSWSLQLALLGEVERNLDRPDSGIWEIRGELRHFTHSRVMLWAAFDRAICAVENDGLAGPVERWRELRAQMAERIEQGGFDATIGSYVQYEGTTEVDAALLQLPHTGYLAYDDPRMLGTVARIEQTLLRDGMVRRYRTESDIDGVPGDENAFLACTFWLVEQYARSGRLNDAIELMDRAIDFRTDLGLLAEQVDPRTGRQAGNFPQALSHLALVRAADAIADAHGTATAGAEASAARGARG